MQKKLYIVAVILVIVAAGLELINIHLSSKLASYSTTVKKIQTSIAKLDEENQILNTKILSQTSFEAVSEKASRLGFVEDHKYISLSSRTKLTFSK